MLNKELRTLAEKIINHAQEPYLLEVCKLGLDSSPFYIIVLNKRREIVYLNKKMRCLPSVKNEDCNFEGKDCCCLQGYINRTKDTCAFNRLEAGYRKTLFQ